MDLSVWDRFAGFWSILSVFSRKSSIFDGFVGFRTDLPFWGDFVGFRLFFGGFWRSSVGVFVVARAGLVGWSRIFSALGWALAHWRSRRWRKRTARGLRNHRKTPRHRKTGLGDICCANVAKDRLTMCYTNLCRGFGTYFFSCLSPLLPSSCPYWFPFSAPAPPKRHRRRPRAVREAQGDASQRSGGALWASSLEISGRRLRSSLETSLKSLTRKLSESSPKTPPEKFDNIQSTRPPRPRIKILRGQPPLLTGFSQNFDWGGGGFCRLGRLPDVFWPMVPELSWDVCQTSCESSLTRAL